MHDRKSGAPAVLGENQSGNMMEIGFQLYLARCCTGIRPQRPARNLVLSHAGRDHQINLRLPCCRPTTAAAARD
jgi:transcription-repair coupling factor (superfamily II helicase)